ncbi:MAG: YeiH family protein [Pseudomonadales bacterium]
MTRRAFNLPTQLSFLLVPLPVLIFIGNPAIGLIAGSALSLSFNARIIPASDKIGKYALQTAIVLLGLKLNATKLIEISSDYSLLVTAYVILTLFLGLVLGRMLNNDNQSSQLISSGTAICGGTTIASLSPVIRATPEQTAVALTLVFMLNAVALFSYPYIGQYLQLTQEQFGIWCALSIHDTASVVATAFIYGNDSGAIATTLKLGRTLWLIPLLVIASILQKQQETKVRLPGFVLLFVMSAVCGSFIQFPDWLLEAVTFTSKALLVLALYCIGTDITRDTLSQLRGPAVLHGLLLWLLVVPLTLGAVYYLV